MGSVRMMKSKYIYRNYYHFSGEVIRLRLFLLVDTATRHGDGSTDLLYTMRHGTVLLSYPVRPATVFYGDIASI